MTHCVRWGFLTPPGEGDILGRTPSQYMQITAKLLKPMLPPDEYKQGVHLLPNYFGSCFFFFCILLYVFIYVFAYVLAFVLSVCAARLADAWIRSSYGLRWQFWNWLISKLETSNSTRLPAQPKFPKFEAFELQKDLVYINPVHWRGTRAMCCMPQGRQLPLWVLRLSLSSVKKNKYQFGTILALHFRGLAVLGVSINWKMSWKMSWFLKFFLMCWKSFMEWESWGLIAKTF